MTTGPNCVSYYEKLFHTVLALHDFKLHNINTHNIYKKDEKNK